MGAKNKSEEGRGESEEGRGKREEGRGEREVDLAAPLSPTDVPCTGAVPLLLSPQEDSSLYTAALQAA
jgi:hypothetical protein